MHVVVILLGLVVGAWIGDESDGLFGAIAGALIATLMFQLGRTRAELRRLAARLGTVERRQQAIPVAETPADPEPERATKPMPSPARVSIYEPDEPPQPAKPEAEPAPPEPAVRSEPSTLEHLIGVAKRWLTTGNVPVKVGIIISFIGVSFLLKFAIENSNIHIPISLRYGFVALFAGVLLGLGWRMRESRRVYALSLQGGGIGILFLVVFAAFRLHGLLSPTLAFSVLVMLTAATGYLAVRQESRALAILGTTGGFLAPILVSTGSGNHVALFSYYLVLNTAVLGVAWVRAWRELNIIGFVFTFGVGTLWGLQYYEPDKFATTAPFLTLFFVFYTVIAILFAFRSKPQLRGYVDGTLVFGTPTIAFALQSQMLRDSEYGLSVSAAIVAVFYALLAAWLWQRKDDRFTLLRQSFVALSVAFATVAVPLALDDRWTAIAWALEGAALVWIGVRQSTSLAKASGALLSFASGFAFVRSGWAGDAAIPVFNGNFVGGLLISLAAMYSAWLLRINERSRQWQGFASVLLLLWDFLWWFGIGAREVIEHAPYGYDEHGLLVFGSLSFAAMAFAGRRFDWIACRRSTLLMLPLLAIGALLYLLNFEHFLVGMGLPGWLLAVACFYYVLFAYGESRAASVSHLFGALFFAALVAYEVGWQIDEHIAYEIWAPSGALASIAATAAILLGCQQSRRWPFSTHFASYYRAALVLIAGFMFFVVVGSLDDPGNPAPLPYIPILNPVDLLAIAGLWLMWRVMRDDYLELGLSVNNRAVLTVWGGVAFLSATLALMRGVHHLASVEWDDNAMMDSTILQASLTIFWALLGVTGMLIGNRNGNRQVWLIGAGLMTVVVLKLMVVDLSNTGTVARIVSFLGVGVLLLVVGYVSPVPPRQEKNDMGGEA